MLTDINDGEGNRIHYTLDNAGNRTKKDTVGNNGAVLRTLSRTYDQLGQLTTQLDAQKMGQSELLFQSNIYSCPFLGPFLRPSPSAA